MVDANGVPLGCAFSGADRHDVTLLAKVVTSTPLRDAAGEMQLPQRLLADRAYDSDPHRGLMRLMGVEPEFARRGTANGSGLGKERYVVERTLANLHSCRRLRTRYERRADVHEALLTLACARLCWLRLFPDKDG